MMTTPLPAKKIISNHKDRPLNYHRKGRLSPIIRKKKEDKSFNDFSREISRLSKSINKICQDESSLSFDETFKSSNSTLGKLYQLYLSLRDNKDDSLYQNVLNDFILKTNQTKINSMYFIQFIKQLQDIAKENRINKDYLYEKILQIKDQKYFINNQNQNNNAFDPSSISHNLLLNEYNKDFSRLKNYFINHCGKSHQMTCSTFIKCIYQNIKLTRISDRLELNGLFYQIQSLLINEEISRPGCLTIDFHGFLLCLQEISLRFHLNLRILIQNLIEKNLKRNFAFHNKSSDTLH